VGRDAIKNKYFCLNLKKNIFIYSQFICHPPHKMEYIKSVGINYFNNNSSFSSKKFPKNYPKNTQILSKKMSNIFPLLAIFLYSSLIYGWKVNQSFRGCFTYYDTPGIGACGKQINPQREMLVAISASQWTSANPNADPICKNICVKVDYKGKR